MASRALVSASLVLGLLLPSACATTNSARGSIHYADEARQAYERALLLYQDEAYEEATEAFRVVRRDYNLSRWGSLAELRLADIDFKQERYAEALGSFRAWLRYHPTQPEAAYAHFMIARCYYSQIPDDWLLVPGPQERDLSSVHDAERSLARFVHDYPDSHEVTEANTMLRAARALLARHEVYVAGFYASRDHFDAAISRLLGVVQNFEGSGEDIPALLQLGEVYLRTGRRPEARGAFEALVRGHANTDPGRAASRYLTQIGPGPSVEVGANTDREPPPPPPPEENSSSTTTGN